MERIGRFFFVVSQVIWVVVVLRPLFDDSKTSIVLLDIYLLCIAIGMMLLSNRMIDDAKEVS